MSKLGKIPKTERIKKTILPGKFYPPPSISSIYLSEGAGVGEAFRSGDADGDGFGVGFGVGGGVGVGVAKPVLMLTRTICPVFTSVPELGD